MDGITIAFHEAGHAAMCMLRNVPFDKVSIAETEEMRGFCRLTGASGDFYMNMGHQSPTFRQMASSEVLICLAGPMSEEIWSGAYDAQGSRNDMGDAYKIALYYSKDNEEGYIKRKKAEAKRMLRSNWPLVQKIALLLLEKSEVDGQMIDNLLKDGSK